MKYKLFKLVSGEMMFGEDKTIDDSTGEYIIGGAVQIALHMTPNNQMAMAMIPFNPFAGSSSETLTINKKHVMCEFEAPQSVINQYIKLTSNIVVPDSKSGEIVV